MVAVSVAKRTTAKSASGAKSAENATSKSYYLSHPSWIEMITVRITTTPDGTRHGVSRPTIKKFVDSKYHLPMNTASASHLNRAITHGADKGNFVLPKGPSGKVKLAPQRIGGGAKENTKLPFQRPAPAKVEPIPTPKAKAKATTKMKAKRVPEVRAVPSKATPATRKYTSAVKKARISTTSGRRAPARKAAAKRSGVKRALTGATMATKKLRSATRKATSLSKRSTKHATK
ncbi:hypothetical protein PAXRUDRAFT_829247 [Paxillus rubicundulus Ve08.2h10]|uniref:Histone H1 n=1 Tax=Paxillus rubicundulus Ve08.2h10 TaxID=930991 RepID=A0A0D0E664_9AGAM|nr:hypothetical protein PAXRUDRAFT_829247 [Paxillus rubicundulus Ve08.2h10]